MRCHEISGFNSRNLSGTANYPGLRIIRDSELGFDARKIRIQGISSGTVGDPGQRDPGQRGATVFEDTSFEFGYALRQLQGLYNIFF